VIERNACVQLLLGLVAARRTAVEEARTTVIARGREHETRFPRLGLVARQERAPIQYFVHLLELQDRNCAGKSREYTPDRFMPYTHVQNAGKFVSEFVLLQDHHPGSLCRRVHRDVVRSKFTMGQGACSLRPSRKVFSG
jgi:hypothetical protein